MKFSIIRSKFLEAMQRVQNVVSTKPTVLILQNAMMKVEDDQLCITTTDLDISEKCTTACEVEVPGGTTLPIKRLVSVIRELNEEQVFIDVGEDDVANVQCGSSYFKINGMPMRDFPPVPETEGSSSYSLSQGMFREMLRKTCYASSLDETRRVLNGVLLSFKDKKLTVVATDGRRLALVEHEVEFPEEAETDLVLPAKVVTELLRILAADDSLLKIYAQKNQVVFDLGTTSVTSKLLEGVYPNYRQIIPTSCEERVVIERDLLLAAIRRVSVVTSDKSNSISMTFSANQLTISSNSPEIGEARDTVPVKYAGEEFTIIFNPDFVMDPLKAIDDDEVFFELNGGNSPALLKCSIPFLYLLMPLRPNN